MSKTNIKEFQEQQFFLKIKIKKELEINVILVLMEEGAGGGDRPLGGTGYLEERRGYEI
jgi:hypothetical protein